MIRLSFERVKKSALERRARGKKKTLPTRTRDSWSLRPNRARGGCDVDSRWQCDGQTSSKGFDNQTPRTLSDPFCVCAPHKCYEYYLRESLRGNCQHLLNLNSRVVCQAGNNFNTLMRVSFHGNIFLLQISPTKIIFFWVEKLIFFNYDVDPINNFLFTPPGVGWCVLLLIAHPGAGGWRVAHLQVIDGVGARCVLHVISWGSCAAHARHQDAGGVCVLVCLPSNRSSFF